MLKHVETTYRVHSLSSIGGRPAPPASVLKKGKKAAMNKVLTSGDGADIGETNRCLICWEHFCKPLGLKWLLVQTLVPLVNIKIAGKWMFIPLKMVLIGIDPYPYNHKNCKT